MEYTSGKFYLDIFFIYKQILDIKHMELILSQTSINW